MRAISLAMTLFVAVAFGTASAEPASSVKLTETGLGTFHLRGEMGAMRDVEFLLDTGSAYVVLAEGTRRELARAGMLIRVRSLRAVMANNTAVQVQVFRVARLQLGPDCTVRDFEAVALPGAPKNILGLSALRAMAPFTVHLSPARLDLTCPMVLAAATNTTPR